MGWLSKKSWEEHRLHQERIRAFEEKYEHTLFLEKGPFYLHPSSPSPSPLVEYTLWPGMESDIDDEFKNLAYDAMEDILKEYQVATHVTCYERSACEHKPRKRCRCFVSFPARYYAFLEAHRLAQDTFLGSDKKEIITLTNGFNGNLLRAAREDDLYDNHHEVYGYQSYPFEAKDFEGIAGQLGGHDIYLRHLILHDHLEIRINPETVDIQAIAEILHRVCAKYGKRLEVEAPPE